MRERLDKEDGKLVRWPALTTARGCAELCMILAIRRALELRVGQGEAGWSDRFGDFWIFGSRGGRVRFLGAGGGNDVVFAKTLDEGIMLPDFRVLCGRSRS